MDLRDLQCFLDVAASGGITRAAAHLHIAQSALSRRLHNLEEDLGVQLFTREWNGVTLTTAGLRLQQMAVPLLAQVDRIRLTLAPNKQLEAGRLQLGMVPGVSRVMHDAVKRFRARHPHIVLSVREGAGELLRAAVISGTLDLVLITNPRRAKGLRLSPVWREAIYIAGPAARARGRNTLGIADVADLPFILASRSPGVRKALEEAFERAGLRFRADLEVDSIATVRRMVAEGSAWCMLPYPSIAAEACSPRIALAAVPGVHITRTLVHRTYSPHSRVLQAFIEVLEDEARALIIKEEWAQAAG